MLKTVDYYTLHNYKSQKQTQRENICAIKFLMAVCLIHTHITGNWVKLYTKETHFSETGNMQ